MAATSSPAMVTEAEATRWITARMDLPSLLASGRLVGALHRDDAADLL